MCKKPNFFIVGAAKSGTTSLAKYLEQHKDIFLSPIKEPFFYVSDYGWKNINDYRSLFKGAGNTKWVGEASTGYLFNENTPKILAKSYPEAKIIICMRNPAKMVLSFWHFMRMAGGEEKSFDEAISENERRYRKTEEFKNNCEGHWWANYLYLERASYAHQIQRYLNHFSREQIKFVLFEELTKNSVECCQEIFQFFDIDTNFVPKIQIHNAGGEKRFEFMKITDNKYLRTKRLLRPLFSPGMREKIRTVIRDLNTKKGKKADVNICQHTLDFVDDFFKVEIDNVETITGLDLSIWRQ